MKDKIQAALDSAASSLEAVARECADDSMCGR
jgi:hypothetical protein